MAFEFSWLLLGLPVAFVLGWLSSRLDWRQMRILQSGSPRTYYRGLTYLLNEQQDKAIDVFVQAVQDDPDTIELHFALGNLFRKRGEYDRAIRVHEHLLARADLSQHDRARAQYDLAQDFMKAGLFDRAETSLQKLIGSTLENDGLLALLFIYERAHDWENASAITHKLEDNAQGDFSGRRAHYLCEQALVLRDLGNFDEAKALLVKAQAESSGSMRPHVERIHVLLKENLPEQAMNVIFALDEHAPGAIPLVAQHLYVLAPKFDQVERARSFLQQQYAQTPCLDTLTALARLDQCIDKSHAAQRYLQHEQQAPSLVAAAHWMGLVAELPTSDDEAKLHTSLQRAQEPLMRYRCAACGFETRQYFWQCPGCQSWESYPPKRIEEL